MTHSETDISFHLVSLPIEVEPGLGRGSHKPYWLFGACHRRILSDDSDEELGGGRSIKWRFVPKKSVTNSDALATSSNALVTSSNSLVTSSFLLLYNKSPYP